MFDIQIEGFVIYNPQTKLFSRGGFSRLKLWSKRAKIWGTLGHVKNHLNMFVYREYNYVDGKQYCKLHIGSEYDGCLVLHYIGPDVVIAAKCKDLLREAAERTSERYGYEIVKD
jgi:hypothetical protein